MTRTWLEPESGKFSQALLDAAGGDAFLASVLAGRGLNQPEAVLPFLDPDQYTETPSSSLPGIEPAVDRLCTAIRDQEPILVWGDYDVDGQTSTTLLQTYLNAVGARVSWHVPVRASEGHGLEPDALKKYLKPGLRVLVTCDTGISEFEGIRTAHKAGLDVIVTDHHNPPENLPEACAIINPKLLPPGHHLGELAGVGVAYKLIQAVERELKSGASLSPDLVALGTIADLALLVDENRYLVQRGLPLLSETPRVGLQAVFQSAGILPGTLNEESVGFALAPRLNAAGRLADANRMVELLSTDDAFKAEIIAGEIEGLNARRKLLSEQVTQAAAEQVERNRALLDEPCLVLSHPAWPGGILGIVASSLVESYNRPVILLSTAPGQAARGSARSIPGIDITAALDANRELLLTHGGHPMAAGLSLAPENLEEFTSRISRTIAELTGKRTFEETLVLDASLPVTALPANIDATLRRLSPFGPGNPALNLFSPGMTVTEALPFGRSRDHLKVRLVDADGGAAEVTWWRGRSGKLPEGQFDLAYTLKVVHFRGQEEIQPTWVDARETAGVIELREQRAALQIHDHRLDEQPALSLAGIPEGERLVWREGLAAAEQSGVTRHELKPAGVLVIWSMPPSFEVLAEAMEKVRPAEVHLYAQDPGSTRLENFQVRLAGLVKYSLNHRQGLATLDELAGAMAHRDSTILAGLDWLAARGDVTYRIEGRQITLAAGGIRQGREAERMLERLLDLLAETSAFHAYYLRAGKHALFE